MEGENKSMGLNETNGSQLVLKNIQKLNGLRFVIPAYQRGFRWRWQQIRELIDDLNNFCKSKNNERIYCLQNITVIKKTDGKGEYYEVVDGQQRLTAIWMLVAVYRNSFQYVDRARSIGTKLPVYEITYAGKDSLNEYCNQVVNSLNEFQTKKDYNSQSKLFDIKADDIDSVFIKAGFFNIRQEIDVQRIEKILADQDILDKEKEICIFWNEISNEQTSQESDQLVSKPKSVQDGVEGIQEDNWAIERFSNLNAGKIPLTESELVKAYFINSLFPNEVPEFSLQWEEIERGMSDDEFWGFLSSKDKEYETRIDFLFDIIYSNSVSSDESHALSLAVAGDLNKNIAAHNVWQNVVQCYQTLRDWYEDYYFYHMIGYIVAVEKESSASVIKKFYDTYIKNSKADFKKALKGHIKKLKVLKPIFSTVENKRENDSQGDLVCIDDAKDLSYNGRDSASIKPVLLLFNVTLLLNAYEINPNNATERFSFKLYKSKNNPIEIEHINPQHLEGKEATETNKQQWAQEVLKIIGNDSLREAVAVAHWDKPNIRLIEQLEEAANLHEISNLTLLDKKLNTSYKDNPFKQKRAHILAARFGYPVPKKAKVAVKDEREDDYYKQSVIFPGTMWVFLREYQASDTSDHLVAGVSQADDTGIPSDSGKQQAEDNTFWTKKDREQYIKTMEESIDRLLHDKENDTQKAEYQGVEENVE